MSTETLIAAPETNNPVISLVLPAGTFGQKELRRILAMQLVINLTCGNLDEAETVKFARRVERYIEDGLLNP